MTMSARITGPVTLLALLAFAFGISRPFAAAIQPRLQQIIEAHNDVNP